MPNHELRDVQPESHADGSTPVASAERSRCVHCLGPNAIVCNRCYGMVAYAPFRPPRWRPIATAPKDGTRVLLLSDHGHVVSGSWNSGGSHYLPHWMGGIHKPTHWMPMPQLPEGHDEAQSGGSPEAIQPGND